MPKFLLLSRNLTGNFNSKCPNLTVRSSFEMHCIIGNVTLLVTHFPFLCSYSLSLPFILAHPFQSMFWPSLTTFAAAILAQSEIIFTIEIAPSCSVCFCLFLPCLPLNHFIVYSHMAFRVIF